ncbi:p-loop containing nucleoside triphosphate hydrolase protein [Pseudohyphozyma bogoriensis]|nr:p-loop containing nucleoside triphosphate hydrolase protein [Pseudohyphozyma bogoriensis]
MDHDTVPPLVFDAGEDYHYCSSSDAELVAGVDASGHSTSRSQGDSDSDSELDWGNWTCTVVHDAVAAATEPFTSAVENFVDRATLTLESNIESTVERVVGDQEDRQAEIMQVLVDKIDRLETKIDDMTKMFEDKLDALSQALYRPVWSPPLTEFDGERHGQSRQQSSMLNKVDEGATKPHETPEGPANPTENFGSVKLVSESVSDKKTSRADFIEALRLSLDRAAPPAIARPVTPETFQLASESFNVPTFSAAPTRGAKKKYEELYADMPPLEDVRSNDPALEKKEDDIKPVLEDVYADMPPLISTAEYEARLRRRIPTEPVVCASHKVELLPQAEAYRKAMELEAEQAAKSKARLIAIEEARRRILGPELYEKMCAPRVDAGASQEEVVSELDRID